MSPDPYNDNSGGPGNTSDPASWNRYIYTRGDPVNRNDPWGLQDDGTPASGCLINGQWWPTYFCGQPRGSGMPAPADPLPLTPKTAWLLAKGFSDRVKAAGGKYTDCEALVDFAHDAADVSKTSDQFVQAFAALIPKTLVGDLGLKWYSAQAVFLNTGRASGFSAPFQNTVPDNPRTGWNGDQGHHFAAFFEYGYLNPRIGVSVAVLYEYLQAGFGLYAPINQGDINVGIVAAELGAALKNGSDPNSVADAIAALCKY